jgi:trans-aconitate 2-methyltransferase
MTQTDVWDPGQYQRFAAERRRPYEDLVARVEPVPGGTVVDLGCGTGELTADLHHRLGAAQTVGLDSSAAMLEKAAAHTAPGLRFEPGDIAGWAWATATPVDVVFANASLHWVPDHAALLAALAGHLAPGGQLAFQVPANHDHPSHTVATELGAERDLEPTAGAASVLAPEDYAVRLYDLGFARQDVRLQVYGFELPSVDDVVEWTKGTLLTGYRAQLPADEYPAFEDEYRRRLAEALGDQRPYFYAFKRILAWAVRP